MKVFPALISACILMIASNAMAMPPSGMTPISLTKPSNALPSVQGFTGDRPGCTYSLKMCSLLRLRAEGLKLQHSDRGVLTESHRAYLQAKLDAIQAD